MGLDQQGNSILPGDYITYTKDFFLMFPFSSKLVSSDLCYKVRGVKLVNGIVYIKTDSRIDKFIAIDYCKKVLNFNEVQFFDWAMEEENRNNNKIEEILNWMKSEQESEELDF